MSESGFPNALAADSALLEYLIKATLWADGFGITYLAHDPIMQRSVVIKEYFPSDLAARHPDGRVAASNADTEFNYQKGLAQFLVEARTLARFVHPNIVRVDRIFEANGTAYMLREYEKGESLAQRYARHPQPDEAALKALLGPLLSGLEAVHDAEVLHRDIKPGNIFVRDEGSPVLVDFGAARLASRDAIQDIIPILTPGYAPVEQYIRSGRQGPWSDIYSLGAVLYWAVTGEHPPDALSRLRMDGVGHVLNAARGRYSRQFIDAIQWALTVEEDRRPRNVAEWRGALLGNVPVRSASGSTSPRETDATRKYVWVALGMVIFYLFVAGADIVKMRQESRLAGKSADRVQTAGAERNAPRNGVQSGLRYEEFAHNLPQLADRFSRIDADGNGRVTTEELQAYWEANPTQAPGR